LDEVGFAMKWEGYREDHFSEHVRSLFAERYHLPVTYFAAWQAVLWHDLRLS
jgi:hypothetical protein